MPDYYYEIRHQQTQAMVAALGVLGDVSWQLAEFTGRSYEALDAYRLDDAERAIVCLGSTAGTIKDVVDELRDAGERVGLLQVHSFRPFPGERLREALSDVSSVAVLDRADSPGGAPPLYAEAAAALYDAGVALDSFVYGLGGRELHPKGIREIFAGRAPHYVGLRSEPCPA
jgi:pyruvate ferredoxin oxidoreductase alpha subunit